VQMSSLKSNHDGFQRETEHKQKKSTNNNNECLSKNTVLIHLSSFVQRKKRIFSKRERKKCSRRILRKKNWNIFDKFDRRAKGRTAIGDLL
jgi:hypothetical protein